MHLFTRIMLAATTALWMSVGHAMALEFGTGRLPIAFEPDAAVELPAHSRIVIEGSVEGTRPITIVLRIDDAQSTDYASRMNIERVLPPGPFSLTFDAARLSAENGRALDIAAIRRIIFFALAGGRATVTRFAVEQNPIAAPQVALTRAAQTSLGFSFGTGTLPIAFEPTTPAAFDATARIDIAGTVEGDGPATLVLRVDDGRSNSYATRMNDERQLPPGPFALRYEVARLATTDGRTLDPADIRRVILFVVGAGRARVSHFLLAGAQVAQPAAQAAAPAVAVAPAQPAVEVVPAPQVSAQVAAPTVSVVPAASAAQRTLGRGALPLKFEPSSAVVFGDADEIRVEGVVAGTAPAAIALRVDDAASKGYPTRFNDERMIPPGPFNFAVGLKGLRSPSGRVLDVTKIARIILFAWQGTPQVTISRFEVVAGAVLPAGAKGYAFGGLDAPLPAGFERIGPQDARLVGRGPITAVRRPAPDPLVANGLRGLRRVTLAAPAGRVRVTVWSEDPGAWELLPHPLDRRIQVNGRDLVVDKWSADQWIAQRYLRGAAIEHTAADDAWSAYGSNRGEARSLDVDVGRDGVTIDISGSDNAAYYLAGVLIEPIAPTLTAAQPAPGVQFVEAQRATWYRSNLPVAPALPADANDGTIALALSWSQAPADQPETLRQRAAPGTGIGFKLAVTSARALLRPRVSVEAPARGGVKLSARLWAAQARLERDDAVLRLKRHRLLADATRLSLPAGEARSYEIWVDVPPGTPAGVYTGALVVADSNSSRSRSFPIEITVLAATLPPVRKPAGFYLARAAHLAYFPGLALERERQVDCDLDVFGGFGLTNTAPPISGLDRADLGVFAGDMRRALRTGVAPGWLIYNPLHDLVAAQGVARASDIVARLEEMIRAQNLPQPLWSVADEPSNADQTSAALPELVKQLRAKSRGVRLAGHLNTPDDEKFVAQFDTLLLNAGFGIDADGLDRLRKSGKGVWLYNTFAPRQTAGLWLWRTAAERYVQWHGRLPTADPFDPIDGREADFQMLYPTAEVCPRQPDIHSDLLRMAEGVVDQRWLLWLDANPAPAARALAAEIRGRLPGPFADVRRLERADLEVLRGRIMDLAGK